MLIPRYESRFRGFHDLVQYRVREILLVSTLYDAFVLEEDRNLSERLFGEYVGLDLRFVPRITRVSTGREALELMQRKYFDLVICMTRLPDMGALDFRREVKAQNPRRPVVYLTYDAMDQGLRTTLRRTGRSDRVYYWFRNTNILTAIVKQVEDARNAPRDTAAGVQVILVVEDSPRYYSLYLPHIYTEILTQTRSLISDGIHDLDRLQRMRARPKIVLAQNWEQAVASFEQYRENIIGVVSDVRFPVKGELDDEAGYRFAELVKAEHFDMPVLLQTSEPGARERADALECGFADKSSGDLLQVLSRFIRRNFGFGDFVFRGPEGEEAARARNVRELYEIIRHLPAERLLYHASRNHFSIWMRARTEFKAAEILRPQRVSHYANPEELRRAILAAIEPLVGEQQDGQVKEFQPSRVKSRHSFVKLGDGSLGGKARGLAFINALLARNQLMARYENASIRIPNTFVITTDIYEAFIEENDLREAASMELGLEDEEISRLFLEARLPRDVRLDLLLLLDKVDYPLAVRSSSLLEDNQTLPFAGIYKTFMLPNNHPDIQVRLRQLCDAIKLVYGSIFLKAPQEYIKNTGYRFDEERMAVVVQEVVGRTHDGVHYPTVSGVARSWSYYPYSGLRPEEGVASLALGLGKAVVESEKVYHFCPAHPRKNPPYGSTWELAESSQTRFWALDVSRPDLEVGAQEDFSLLSLPLERAEDDGVLRHVASTLTHGGVVRDTIAMPGPRVVRFAQLLKHGTVPLVRILQDLLAAGQESFGSQVEIEFAADIGSDNHLDFQFLQIRPMVLDEALCVLVEEDLTSQATFVASVHAMGNGCYDRLYDLVYLDPDRFDVLHTREMAMEIERINAQLRQEGRHYVLLGFGRWATSDPSLGVPVTWNQVSQARVFAEADRHDLWVEPSQGSHFFQNMLALRLGYLFIKESRRGNRIDWDWLQAQPAVGQHRWLRHLRFDQPLIVEIDGRTSRGVIYKPGAKPSPCCKQEAVEW